MAASTALSSAKPDSRKAFQQFRDEIHPYFFRKIQNLVRARTTQEPVGLARIAQNPTRQWTLRR